MEDTYLVKNGKKQLDWLTREIMGGEAKVDYFERRLKDVKETIAQHREARDEVIGLLRFKGVEESQVGELIDKAHRNHRAVSDRIRRDGR